MKETLTKYYSLYQKTMIGYLRLDLHPKEKILLKLRFASEKQMMELWVQLWDGIHDYDELPAGCRTLMPAVVRKMQGMQFAENWQRVHGLDLTFLSGLPRYVWTKNKYMLNETLRVAEHVGKSGIEIMAIKGMAALLSDTEMGMMRSTSDIDLLIKPQDFEIFKQKMAEIGFYQVKDTTPDRDGFKEKLTKRSPLPIDQYTFKSNDTKTVEIDIHLMVNQYQANDQLTSLTWRYKVQSTHCKHLFVPSPSEDFLIALVNGFRITNWHSGSYLKYLCDSLTKFDSLQPKEIEFLGSTHAKTLEIQDWQTQIIQLGLHLAGTDQYMFKSCQLNYKAISESLSPANHLNYRLVYTNIIKRLIRRLSDEKKGYLLLLLTMYKKAWKSRSKQGYFVRTLLFLATDPVIQLGSFLGRRANTIPAKEDIHQYTRLVKTPISNVQWD